jgi:cytochrome c nitrite reductase small subunit
LRASQTPESSGREPVLPSVTKVALIIGALLGILFGLGAFTFDYAHGLSYLSSDPAACVNCHIMQSQYDSWQRASHRSVATCVDCHLPQRGLAKWMAKADNGYRHSEAFTFQDFREPIMMTAGNRRILQRSCLECHRDLIHQMAAGRYDAVECVHCHSGVGHGERAALGGPESASVLQLEEVDQ